MSDSEEIRGPELDGLSSHTARERYREWIQEEWTHRPEDESLPPHSPMRPMRWPEDGRVHQLLPLFAITVV